MSREHQTGRRAVVIDIDGDVDAVPVPIDIIETVETSKARDRAAAVLLLANLVKCAMTYPIQRDGQDDRAFRLKQVAYTLATIYELLEWKITDPKLKGGSLAGIDLLILAAALSAELIGGDGIGTVGVDIISNLGGVVQGVAQACEQEEIVVFGAGISFLAGLAAALLAAADTADDVMQFVNVGG